MAKEIARPDPSFWRGKRVLLTGHTGFKGSWAALWLSQMGASVTGLALLPESAPSMFELAGVANAITSRIGDIRDRNDVLDAVSVSDPEIVLHLAAQPIVRRAIADPVTTIETNVTGTAILLDTLRNAASLRTILVVTSDKVYANDDGARAFAEDDRLGGKDPYSASKAAAEIVTRSFAETYFEPNGVRVATARGGNVIGGGDYAADRIVPDIVRAAKAGQAPILRMPHATRPWQHVLDCLAGYLVYVQELAANPALPRALNFGPVPGHDVTVQNLTAEMLAALKRPGEWRHQPDSAGKEMAVLAVDSSQARALLGWQDLLAGELLAAWTADWYRRVEEGSPAQQVCLEQILAYEHLEANAR